MKKNLLFCLLSQAIALSIAQASTPPTDLMYLNKPIDSLCFGSESGASTIDLKHCGATKELTIKAMNPELSKQGYLGYDFENKSYSPSSQGFSYYKYFPINANKYWVYALNNSGGTGQFSSINWVERKNANTLVLSPIASGDRCNGGVQDVTVEANTLHYSVHLTAYDLIKLGNKGLKLKPYDDLATCAVCCSAKSFYTLKGDAKPVLSHVELNEVADVSELSEQGTLASCFNTLFVAYTKTHSRQLTPAQLTEFATQFKNTCVK